MHVYNYRFYNTCISGNKTRIQKKTLYDHCTGVLFVVSCSYCYNDCVITWISIQLIAARLFIFIIVSIRLCIWLLVKMINNIKLIVLWYTSFKKIYNYKNMQVVTFWECFALILGFENLSNRYVFMDYLFNKSWQCFCSMAEIKCVMLQLFNLASEWEVNNIYSRH